MTSAGQGEPYLRRYGRELVPNRRFHKRNAEGGTVERLHRSRPPWYGSFRFACFLQLLVAQQYSCGDGALPF